MGSKFKNLFLLNTAILLIATSAPIGGYVSTPPEISILTRCFFAIIVIGVYMKIKSIGFHFDYKNDSGVFALSAILQGLHWITYFYALKYSGAGLGLIALFTYPIFTTLLEPVLLKTAFNPKHILLALLVLLGLYILTPEFTFGNETSKGIAFGVISALFYAIRNILMKKKVAQYNASMLMFYQVLFVFICLTPLFFLLDFNLETYQLEIKYLLILGIVTTAMGHTLLVKSFDYFSATTASLLSCIQPVHGVIFGYLFLGEIPTLHTIIGGLLIVSAVVLESLFIKAKKAK